MIASIAPTRRRCVRDAGATAAVMQVGLSCPIPLCLEHLKRPLPAAVWPAKREHTRHTSPEEHSRWLLRSPQISLSLPRTRRPNRPHTAHAALSAAGHGASMLFSVSTLYCVPLFAMMLLLPKSRLTVSTMHSDWIFVPLSMMYITLLLQSWTPKTLQLIMPGSLQAGLTGKFSPQFFPQLEGIQFLFSQTTTAASLWIHVLSINLFAARTAYLQGLHDRFASLHSVFLSMLFGPLGLLSHHITQAICASRRRSDSASAAATA